MPELNLPEEMPASTKIRGAERKRSERRVILDPSSPSVRSIARVVVITLLLVAVAGYVQSIISSLTYLFFLVVLSVFFAYLIDPIVILIRKPFKKRGADQWMPRWLAIVIAYIIVFTGLCLAIANIAPRVIEQAKEFGTNLPGYGTAIQQRANELNRRFDRLKIPDEVQGDVTKKVTEAAGYVSTAIGGFVLISATFVPWLLLIPILAFFFLKDVNIFRLAVLRSFPAGRWRIRAEAVLQDVNSTLAAYTRAQLISCFLIGLICTIGFWALGLKYALLLGILAGIFEFVPLLGPAAIGLIVVLTAAASDNPWKALYVAIFLIILRIFQDYVLYPRIVRDGIHLHPLAIILSVLAGEQIAGIPGVFLSIPIVAILTVFYRHVLEHQGKRDLISHWFEEDENAIEETA